MHEIWAIKWAESSKQVKAFRTCIELKRDFMQHFIQIHSW